MRWRAVGLAFAAGLALAPALAPESSAAGDRIEQGRRLFVDQGCYGCHTIGAFGTPIGPDLSRIGGRYAEPYLERWLRDPAALRPAAHMPKLELTESQVQALAAFLASLH